VRVSVDARADPAPEHALDDPENLNPDVEIEGILPTLVDTRTVHAKEAIEILEENFGDRVFASRIKKTVRFAEAPVKGMSVLKYDPTARRPTPTASWRRRSSRMASGKRASMREGPLAALFRKTEETRGSSPAEPRAERGAREPQRARARAEEARAAARARSRPRRAAPGAASAPRAAPDARRSPRPEERLRHVFSSDIPENIMEPAPPRARSPRRADEPRAAPRRARRGSPCCASSASAAPASTPSTA
jgi:hypothetical protein